MLRLNPTVATQLIDVSSCSHASEKLALISKASVAAKKDIVGLQDISTKRPIDGQRRPISASDGVIGCMLFVGVDNGVT